MTTRKNKVCRLLQLMNRTEGILHVVFVQDKKVKITMETPHHKSCCDFKQTDSGWKLSRPRLRRRLYMYLDFMSNHHHHHHHQVLCPTDLAIMFLLSLAILCCWYFSSHFTVSHAAKLSKISSLRLPLPRVPSKLKWASQFFTFSDLISVKWEKEAQRERERERREKKY